MNIGIGTAFSKDADWMFLGANCFELIQKYCNKNPNLHPIYDIVDPKEFHPGWIKHLFVQQNYKNYDYFLYLDPDATIENFDFDLEELISNNSEKDFFISRDPGGLIAGVFLVKNSKFFDKMLSDIFSYIDLYKISSGDQDAINRFINNNFRECLDKIKFVDPSIFHLTTHIGGSKESCIWKNYKYNPFIFHYPASSIFNKQRSLIYKTITGDRNTFINFFEKDVVGTEVGVHLGHYASDCLSKIPGNLILIDDYRFDINRKDITNQNQETRDQEYEFVCSLFKNHKNVKILRLSSSDAVKLFPDNFLDYVYIDADHQYESVKKDLNIWWPKIKKGGLLCGHDYLNYIDDTSTIEVKKAVDEFCYNRFPVKGFISSEDNYKSWFIYK